MGDSIYDKANIACFQEGQVWLPHYWIQEWL